MPAHFLTVADLPRTRGVYAGVLGGEVVMDGPPCTVKFANSWVIVNEGGGPIKRRLWPPAAATSSAR